MPKYIFSFIPIFLAVSMFSCARDNETCVSKGKKAEFYLCVETKESTPGVDERSVTLNGKVSANGAFRVKVLIEISGDEKFKRGEIGIVPVETFEYGELGSFEFGKLIYSEKANSGFYYRVVVPYKYLDITGLSFRGTIYGNIVSVESEIL